MTNAEKEIQAGDRKLAEMDFKAALSRFKKAIRLDPKAPEAHFGKAEAGLGVPNVAIEEIISDYKSAIEQSEGNPFYYARLGAFCLDVGEWELAEDSYKSAAEADPDNAYLYFSEFGLEYFHNRLMRLEEDGEMTPPARDEVASKALGYVLKSLGMSPDDAKKLLG